MRASPYGGAAFYGVHTIEMALHLAAISRGGRRDATVNLGPDYLQPGLRMFLDSVCTNTAPIADQSMLDVVEILESCLGEAGLRAG